MPFFWTEQYDFSLAYVGYVEARHRSEAPLITPTDPLAERSRKIGGMTLPSIGHVGRVQRVLDNDADRRDIATASLIETWIDETEQRTWFLFETGRKDR